MIAYFDTSALIPLVVEEPGSDQAAQVWDAADRLVTVRVAYPEARAALARARQLARLDARRYRAARDGLEDLWRQLDRVEVTAPLAQRAGDLAEALALRGHDAVHLAAAETVADADVVFVAGDGLLVQAASALGLAISRT